MSPHIRGAVSVRETDRALNEFGAWTVRATNWEEREVLEDPRTSLKKNAIAVD